MNTKAKNANLAALSLDELIALKQRGAKVAEAVAGEVQAIRELSAGVVDAKNAADHGNTLKGSLWSHVFAVAAKVAELTTDATDTRYQVFTDALAEFLIPATGADGKPVKLSTAGQYASTGRKLLLHVTDTGEDIAIYADKTRKDVMQAFKDTKDAALLDKVAEANKRLRFVVKHGTDAEKEALVALLEMATDLYNPVLARKDKTKRAAQADATLRDNRQQQPTEGATVEMVAGNIAETADDGAGEEVKVAVNA